MLPGVVVALAIGEEEAEVAEEFEEEVSAVPEGLEGLEVEIRTSQDQVVSEVEGPNRTSAHHGVQVFKWHSAIWIYTLLIKFPAQINRDSPAVNITLIFQSISPRE